MPKKLFSRVNCEKNGGKSVKVLFQLKLLSIQERKEFEGEIKLENKLIDIDYNRVLQKMKILP